MSGGHYDYLYCKETYEFFSYSVTSNLDDMAEVLIKEGYEDVARDLTRLSEYIKSARNRVDVLKDQLKDVMHAVEWWASSDYGDDNLKKHINMYRDGINGKEVRHGDDI